MPQDNPIIIALENLAEENCGPFDLLPQDELVEKLVELDIAGVPDGPAMLTDGLAALADQLGSVNTDGVEVVVFGGGTGLSNVIGGDSRNSTWPRNPFQGLKSLFPLTRSIVCVTDDGGSTGELLKDFPIIALGDLRHVLLSSIQESRLADQYGLGAEQAAVVANTLFQLFNFRFSTRLASLSNLLEKAAVDLAVLPKEMAEGIKRLLDFLFSDGRFGSSLARPHCLGNLLLVAAIYFREQSEEAVSSNTFMPAIKSLAELIGALPEAVLPCTTTSANLKAMYANGVMATGEYRSSQARRGYPIDRVFVEFATEPKIPDEVLDAVARAHVIVFAPGSLFTSIVPILQVPGIAQAVRNNKVALKILVTNLWVQKGETDLVRENPRRRFYVSDLIQAYHRNIPGGLEGLFDTMLVLGLHDIPGSVLQGYALEGKRPILLDKDRVRKMGFNPFEARIFSKQALRERGVVQHDSQMLARAIRTLWAARTYIPRKIKTAMPSYYGMDNPVIRLDGQTPDQRLAGLRSLLDQMSMDAAVRESVTDILWRYWDIPLSHLHYLDGIDLVPAEKWPRSQKWDNIASFYDPDTRCINIKEEIFQRPYRFEFSFLLGLGQSLLGNYAAGKEVLPVEEHGKRLGSMFRLKVRPAAERQCFLQDEDLANFLYLARMKPITEDLDVFTRLINNEEGFTPPGLFFGLTYAWYLDNRFTSHIEYKMAVFRMAASDLIPYHSKTVARRREIVDFFRKTVFCHSDPAYEEKPVEVD